jgi:hypothetical protein
MDLLKPVSHLGLRTRLAIRASLEATFFSLFFLFTDKDLELVYANTTSCV